MKQWICDAFYEGKYELVLSLLRDEAGRYDLKTLGELLPEVHLDQVPLDGQPLASALFSLASEVWDVDECLGIAMLRQAAELGSFDAVRALGEGLNWMGDHENAIPWLRRAIVDSEGEASRLRGLLGESLWARRSFEDPSPVESLLRAGMQDSPEFGLVLAEVLLDGGRREDARALLDVLVQSSVYGAALLLGNLLSSSPGDHDEAERAYLAGIASGDAHSAHNLAAMLLEMGNGARAYEYHRLAQEMGDLSALE